MKLHKKSILFSTAPFSNSTWKNNKLLLFQMIKIWIKQIICN